ncbi:MAG: outer membrane lipoprotein carrier protein LolA [Myxococcales bacterium]|jgi:outer membrane lipoprotein carrier protein
MKARLLFALLLAGSVPFSLVQAQPAEPTPAAPAAEPPPEPAAKAAEVVAKVQEFYDATGSFQAGFRQKFWAKAYRQEKISSGRVVFVKPGKMDWAYDDPKDNRVVADGKIVKVYEAANSQMFEQPMDKSQFPAALSFLTGGGKLSETFTFELYAGNKGTWNFPGGWILVGLPKVASPAYTKVLFYVDQQAFQVLRVMVLDGQGNRNRFDFIDPKRNVSVDMRRFEFTPPSGTKIIRP